jgi:hypothetical protein
MARPCLKKKTSREISQWNLETLCTINVLLTFFKLLCMYQTGKLLFFLSLLPKQDIKTTYLLSFTLFKCYKWSGHDLLRGYKRLYANTLPFSMKNRWIHGLWCPQRGSWDPVPQKCLRGNWLPFFFFWQYWGLNSRPVPYHSISPFW